MIQLGHEHSFSINILGQLFHGIQCGIILRI